MEPGGPLGTQDDVVWPKGLKRRPKSRSVPDRRPRSACGKAGAAMIRAMKAPSLPNRWVWPALAACLGAAAMARAESPARIDPVQPAATARYPDAAEIARGSGIGEAEASRRLRLQEVSAPHVSGLRREFAGRLAGLYLESEGDYRLVLRLKGPTPVADRWIGSGRDRMRIQFLPGAPATLAEILEKVAAAMPAIGARLPGLMGAGVDERTGEVMLSVHAVGEAAERVRAADPDIEHLIGHPVRIEISAAPLTNG